MMIADRLCYGRLLGPVMFLVLIIYLSACAAPAQPAGSPTTQPPDPPPANLQTRRLAHLHLANLHHAAYNYARYHALAPDDLLGLKRLAEVCAALEDPSTGPFGEAQDRLRAGAGVEDESCREAAERVLEGQGDKETRGQGDKETRGQGDKGTRRQGDKERGRGSALHSPLSILLPLCCTRNWKPAPTTGVSWRNCWTCRWRRRTAVYCT